MRAVTWHGQREVRVEDAPDPVIEEPTDAIIKITSSGLCGSDLHLYEVLGPYLRPGVVPFQIACGSCFTCSEGLHTQCETTQVTEQGMGAALIGVYGGSADPLPLLNIFDKQIQLRTGQANVRRWVDDIMPLLTDDDPLGVDDFATHRVPLEEAPQMYDDFQNKSEGIFTVVFQP
jgi:threonine dehydrogenase-like Zn-dependent dehydrogenase